MKNLIAICILGASLALVSCGESPQETSTPGAASEMSTSSKAGVHVNIFGLEASGNDCIVNIKLNNKTGKNVRLFQITQYTALYKGGEHSSHASHYKLKKGASTKRAGVMVEGAACKDVQEVRVDSLLCNFDRDPKTMMSKSCADTVVLKGSKQVKLTMKPK